MFLQYHAININIAIYLVGLIKNNYILYNKILHNWLKNNLLLNKILLKPI